MALSDILLRTLSHPTLTAKGSALTWPEEDTNFVELYEAVFGVTDFTNSGVAAYDGGTTYSEDDIVAYNGFLYTYINPVDSSGNAPPNPTYWELTGGASLAHVQNKDQYLDLGGTYQVSAQEIRAFIDTPLDISTKWDISGNTLAARGTFGSTSGAYGWDFKRNNTVFGGLGDTTGWFWGTSAAFTDTDHSFKGSGNTSSTYNSQWHNSTTNEWIARLKNSGCLQIKTNSALGLDNVLELYDSTNALIFEFRVNSFMKTAGGFLNASDEVTANFYASNLYRANNVVVSWGSTILKDWDTLDSINWHFRYLAVNLTEKLNWNSNYFDGGNWRVNTGNNFGLGSSPSYGGGVGVMFIANAGTIPSSDPTDGYILYVDPADDKLYARGPGGLITVLANPV